MPVFKEAVEKKTSDPHGFTEGETKETIKHCIQQLLKRGSARAKILLEQRYKNPHKILADHCREIKAWPLLKPSDFSGYKKFYNFLLKCESIMALQHWNSMDAPEILCMLILKLVGNTRDRWNRKVLTIRRQYRREAELEDFIDFFDDETQLANDPLFSREALRDYTEKADKVGNNKKRIKQYVGKTKVEEKSGDTKDGDSEFKKVTF